MAIELHHLHPGHDDELSRLKARIAELEKENQTLAEDVSDKIESITELMELVEKYKSEKAELEDERRWRNVDDEFPTADEGYILVLWEDGLPDIGYIGAEDDVIETVRDRGEGHSVEWWMPQPSAPKEERC